MVRRGCNPFFFDCRSLRAKIKKVARKTFLWGILLVLAASAKPAGESLRGKLTLQAGNKPAIETRDDKIVFLEGDAETAAVLRDKRLTGSDLEVNGHFKPDGVFVVDPIYTKAMFVHKGGKKLMITYYCKVCAIRTYTPGKCMCCQQETELDLIPPDQQ